VVRHPPSLLDENANPANCDEEIMAITKNIFLALAVLSMTLPVSAHHDGATHHHHHHHQNHEGQQPLQDHHNTHDNDRTPMQEAKRVAIIGAYPLPHQL